MSDLPEANLRCEWALKGLRAVKAFRVFGAFRAFKAFRAFRAFRPFKGPKGPFTPEVRFRQIGALNPRIASTVHTGFNIMYAK